MMISMLRRTLSPLLIGLVLVSLSHASPVRVFVVAGQSNMLGTGKMEDLPTEPVDLTQPRDDIAYHFLIRGAHPHVAADWSPLRPLWPGFVGTTYGAELTFGRRIAEQFPGESIAIIKVAQGGTDLQGDWHPSGENGTTYQAMIDHVALALGQLEAAGDEPVLSGFVWVQGSGDANNEAKAIEYEANLNALIASVREDWGVSDLPVLFSEYHIDSNRPVAGIAALRQSQANVAAADPRALMIQVDDLPLKSDFIHFSGAMNFELGDRFADAYVSLVAAPEPSTFVLCGMGLIGLVVGSAIRRRHSS
jgi:hypothetical protein